MNCSEGLKTQPDDWPPPSCTITTSGLRDIALVEVEIKEISNALEAFKSEVTSGASVGELPYGRLIKE